MMPALWDHQIAMVDGVRAEVARGKRRVLLQAATGSGKTTTVGEIIRRALLKGSRVLFLAHMRRLVTQAAREFTRFGLPCGIVMAGVRSTPAPVQVASRDTLLSRRDLPPADIVIVDEARHALAPEYQALVESYPRAVHIGLDATPVRDDGRGMGDIYDALVCCAPTAELVARGVLVPVRCYAAQDRAAGKRRLSGDPVDHWKRLADGRPTAVFCSRVKQSLAVCKQYNDAGIPAEHIDGNTPDDARDAIVARVESGKTLVVSSIMTMTEGVDVPCLSCAQLLCLCPGYAGFIQRIGRIRRRFPGKREAILIDHADAVMEHGLPDDPVEWTLSQSETVDQRNSKARKEGKRAKPVVCPNCHAIYAPTKGLCCPECGHRLPQKMVPPKLRAQLLTEVEASLTAEERSRRRVAFWRSSIAIAANKGLDMRAAAAIFRRKYPEGPTPELPNYPEPGQWWMRAAEAFPQYLRRAGA